VPALQHHYAALDVDNSCEDARTLEHRALAKEGWLENPNQMSDDYVESAKLLVASVNGMHFRRV
jgi:aconitase B